MSDKLKPNDPTVQMPIMLPKSLHESAKKKSRETGISISHIIRKALTQWTKGQEPKEPLPHSHP